MHKYWPMIAQGIGVTLELAVLVVISGVLLGLVLACVRLYNIRIVNALIVTFADLMRALPPLVLILIVYFGLPNLGITLSGFTVVWLILSLALAAFAEEIFWAGLLSVPKGQWEAARATGIGFLWTLIVIVLPQAFSLAIPPLTNRAIGITKSTALGTVISVPEILNQASTALSFSGNATPLMMGAVAYMMIFIPFVILTRWIERRFTWRNA
ncbi:amino acid ABC transporter permease [Celerinatantimonas sp. MCCC 1A17872]